MNFFEKPEQAHLYNNSDVKTITVAMFPVQAFNGFLPKLLIISRIYLCKIKTKLA